MATLARWLRHTKHTELPSTTNTGARAATLAAAGLATMRSLPVPCPLPWRSCSCSVRTAFMALPPLLRRTAGDPGLAAWLGLSEKGAAAALEGMLWQGARGNMRGQAVVEQ